MRTLSLLVVLGLAGCQTVPRRSSNLFDPIFHTLSTPHDATWGPMMVIASLTVLIGIVAFWAFKARRTGVGLVLSGFGVGFLARVLQAYEAQLALLLLLIAVAGIIYAATNANFRRKLLKHAKFLRDSGETAKAEALEAEAHDEIEPAIRKEKQNGHRKSVGWRRHLTDAPPTDQ